ANPAAIAAIEPKFAVAAQSATALIATSVIVTSILVPIITAMYHKRYAKTANNTQTNDINLEQSAAS
ncbi:2-keto-3-deoxygluconate permease, partial [Catenovulum agarivorans]|uniref:2-keto-3-deoxygluconate permease n=1 Tax=Catenovulum agarivorans TaxID=1172192 RepID=UPI00058C9A6F